MSHKSHIYTYIHVWPHMWIRLLWVIRVIYLHIHMSHATHVNCDSKKSHVSPQTFRVMSQKSWRASWLLHGVAVCCSVLQSHVTQSWHASRLLLGVAVCCSVLQCVAVWVMSHNHECILTPTWVTSHSWLGVAVMTRCCSVLQCVAESCHTIMTCILTPTWCCSVLQCVAVWCSVLQCVAVCCSVLQSHVTQSRHASGPLRESHHTHDSSRVMSHMWIMTHHQTCHTHYSFKVTPHMWITTFKRVDTLHTMTRRVRDSVPMAEVVLFPLHDSSWDMSHALLIQSHATHVNHDSNMSHLTLMTWTMTPTWWCSVLQCVAGSYHTNDSNMSHVTRMTLPCWYVRHASFVTLKKVMSHPRLFQSHVTQCTCELCLTMRHVTLIPHSVSCHTCESWLKHESRDTHDVALLVCATCLTHGCDMSHPHAWQASFMCVTWHSEGGWRETQTGRERERERKGEREREMCVCTYVGVCMCVWKRDKESKSYNGRPQIKTVVTRLTPSPTATRLIQSTPPPPPPPPPPPRRRADEVSPAGGGGGGRTGNRCRLGTCGCRKTGAVIDRFQCLQYKIDLACGSCANITCVCVCIYINIYVCILCVYIHKCGDPHHSKIDTHNM